MSGMETCVNPKCVDYQFMHPGMCSTNEEVEAQWRAGNAEPVDTGTATTDATPTPTDREGSVNAGADSQLFSFLKTLPEVTLPPQEGMTFPAFTANEASLSKQGYLVKITREQVETAEVFPLTIGQAESLEDRERRQKEAYRKQINAWWKLRRQNPILDPIIVLHKPDESLECMGCDGGPDYAGDWPCRTIETIEEEMTTPKRHPIYKRTTNPIMYFDPGCA